MANDPVVIVSAARTPIGGFQGELKGFAASQLGAAAIRAAVERASIESDTVEEVIMGCVLPAGQGQAPARQASLGAGLPLGTGCTTINKMCGSGMKAAMFAHDLLAAGTNDIMVAGGMESMSNAPYLLPKARSGYRMGHQQVMDHMFLDGLEDVYDKGVLMGAFAENCADKYSFTREQQDNFSITSLRRAQKANEDGSYAWETVPIAIMAGKDERFIERDEQPFKANFDKIPRLKPAFRKDGTVTAANASTLNDGAAALVLTTAHVAQARGYSVMARVVADSSVAQEPKWFTTAPVEALKRLYEKTETVASDWDLYEINEAFAGVTMAAVAEHQLDADAVNVNGGAVSIGHPIGCSGARILVTLLYALKDRGLKRGVASLCIGGGEAVALGVEMVG